MVGDAIIAYMTEERKAIVEYLKGCDGPCSPLLISKATGVPHDSVRHLVLKLADAGVLVRPSYGHYKLSEAASVGGNVATRWRGDRRRTNSVKL